MRLLYPRHQANIMIFTRFYYIWNHIRSLKLRTMPTQTFEDYLHSTYSNQNSRAAGSYIKAIEILDRIFSQRDVFNLNNQSLADITDPILIAQIIDFVAEEEDKFRNEQNSIFDLGLRTQTSYPKKRFCTAAIRRLG